MVLFDPREEYLKPRLRLYRLQGEDYVPVVPAAHLESVDLNLVVTEAALRLQNPNTGQLLPTRADTLAQAAQAQAEKARADEAEAKARSLEAELARLKGG